MAASIGTSDATGVRTVQALGFSSLDDLRHVSNVRRKGDVLLADLLFTPAEGIKAVRDGKRAVSVGYDAEYVPIGPGRERQRNIVANHARSSMKPAAARPAASGIQHRSRTDRCRSTRTAPWEAQRIR